MMTIVPDKWVRKAIHSLIDGMTVNGQVISCFDVNATNYTGKYYVIMSTQNKNQTFNKCINGWDYFILLDIVTRYRKNAGTRVMADDIEQEIITRLDGLVLEQGLTISRYEIISESDLTTKTDAEVIHRKFLRYNFDIV